MKLFVVAALIAVASAARLENLERGYLPPNGQGQVSNDVGPNGQPGFRGQQGLGGPSVPGANVGAATSNQYLPPNQGGAANGLGVDDASVQPNQFGAAPNAGAQTIAGARPGTQYQAQPSAGQNAPAAGDNFQNIPQQEFDDQTGYKY